MSANELLTWIHSYGYPVLGLIAIPEGPMVMVLSGFLVKLDIIDFWPAYLALCAGDFVSDIWWYWVGYKLGTTEAVRRYRSRGVDTLNLDKIGRAFHKYQTLVLVGSKLTCGFGVMAIPVIVAAGAFRVPFRKFLLIYGGGVLLWTLVPMGTGYFFGEWYDSIESVYGRVVLLGTLAVTGVACFYFLWPMFGGLIGRKVIPK